MLEMLAGGAFWFAVAQIVAIDLLLGGDNAIVIALACRRLPEAQRRRGIFWGAVGAIVLRIALTFFALQLLQIPYLKIVGALALLWIGVKLLLPQADAEHDDVRASAHLAGAIRTIVVADAVMSVDNVVAVAGAAHGDIVLVAFGIVISIPVIVWGSRLVLRLMEHYPSVVTLGAALLGWIAGGMLVDDAALAPRLALPAPLRYLICAAGALLVVVLGHLLATRSDSRAPDAP